jgi:tetratricopeptide (TPR) repeat protein
MVDRSTRFFTETAAMRTLTLSSSAQGDRSFRIGLIVIALFAAAEIFSASYYYLGRLRIARTTVQPAVAVTAPTPAAPAASAAPPAPIASPPAAASPSTSALSVADRLLKEATALRERGDTTNALARLQEAAQKDPKNAQVLAEMATIYESIQLFDRSNETWRKIEEVGPAAGALYELAEAKLKTGVTATPAPAAVEATSGEAATSRTGGEGIPEGSTFGITEASATETPDTYAETNLVLRIAIKARPNTVIDHTKVKIQVYFFDTVDDKDIKLTDAEVNYEWLTPNHDWAQSNPEVLAVTYVRPKNKALSQEAALSAAAAAVNPGKKGRPSKPPEPTSAGSTSEAGRRRYLGYIVRVYYNDKLQAVRAYPTKLLNLFPPPSTASSP